LTQAAFFIGEALAKAAVQNEAIEGGIDCGVSPAGATA
jgi:hypothetical protein